MTTIQDALAYAEEAGFNGEGAVTVVSIAMAESGLNERAQHANGPTSGCPNGSLDRGILQINSCYWAKFPDAVCYNPKDSFVAGYEISRQGTNFNPWTTYAEGTYKTFLGEVQGVYDASQPTNGNPVGDDLTIENNIAILARYIARLLSRYPVDISDLPPIINLEPSIYVVKSGDSLWSIAQLYYGDGRKWPIIYNANQGTIGTDPNRIAVGETLVIPVQQ